MSLCTSNQLHVALSADRLLGGRKSRSSHRFNTLPPSPSIVCLNSRGRLPASKFQAELRRPGWGGGARGAASWSLRAASSVEITSTASGGDDGPGGNDASGGGGGDDSGAEGSGAGGAAALLAAAGRSADSLPADLAAAVKAGKVSLETLQRYLELEATPILNYFLQFAGSRERLLADPGFPVKVGIELGIGLVCKVTAEWNKRGEEFNRQLDFVLANVIMALIADLMLVWLPAPTLSFAAASPKRQGRLASFLATCPDNAFQVVPAGSAPWSLGQRSVAVARNGAKLLGVGFTASMLGVGITNALIAARSMMDPDFKPQNPPQNPVITSAAYATYMASSSNLRYQILAGVIEERGIERIFAGQPSVCHLASFIIRTANTFVGSLLWVDYLRLLGLQKKAPAKQ